MEEGTTDKRGTPSRGRARKGRSSRPSRHHRNVASIPLLPTFHETSPSGRRRGRMNGLSRYNGAQNIDKKSKKVTSTRAVAATFVDGGLPLSFSLSLSLSLSLHPYLCRIFTASPPKNGQGKCRKMGQKRENSGRREALKSRGCLKFKFRVHARIFHPFPHPFTTHSLTFDKMCTKGGAGCPYTRTCSRSRN